MDAVILYVNCEDPLWQKDFRRKARGDFRPNRFRDWGTLPFLFRGIAKYLPFIEKIHLVVSRESQVPGWIDREKVNIVLHKDIIPEQYLPTFNSCVIETHIPYIEGLSEEFIYFNDDMFPINPCEPELFFKEGRPQECFKDKNIMYGMTNIYRRQCWNSMNWSREALGMEVDMDYICPQHWPHPMLKSYCLEILQIQADKYRKQVSALRTMQNVNQYLFLDYQYLGGLTDRVELPWSYTTTGKPSIGELRASLQQDEAKVLCINDNDCNDARYPTRRAELFALFLEKFPERCKYEKERGGDLIVSMTTYPARSRDAARVWNSILSQQADIPFRCMMILYEGDFPGRKLPYWLREPVDLGQVEVLWYQKNLRSHLKLLPVMKEYPDADVITIDDDMTKPQGWLQNMIDEHRRWPEDIISCSYTFYLDSDFRWQRMKDLPQKNAQGKNSVPSLVFQFSRICSGHGTLFPAHTYDGTGFFDEDEAMRLVPTCDETWMWMWAMLAGKNFRQNSWVFDESEYTLDGTQKMPTTLWRKNRNLYDQMYAGLFREHPEFKEELQRRQKMYVVAPEEERERFPYYAVITSDCRHKIAELLRRYWDCPNKIQEFEGAVLFPPGEIKKPSVIEE